MTNMLRLKVVLILEERKPAIDDIMGAYWTGTGICAHESAMKGGEVITIPRFE